MVWTKIIGLFLLGCIALSAAPASAKPAGRHHAGFHHHQRVGHAHFAGTRHARASRRVHAHRRHVPLRSQPVAMNAYAPEAMDAYASIPDRHSLGQEPAYAAYDSNMDRAKPSRRSRAMDVPQAAAFGGGVVSEARRWIGTNPTGRSSLWCARFMNFVLERTGHQGSGSDMARSFSSYGQRISGPQIGAIAVMSRGRGGHVGVVSGIDASGNPIVISGNHGRRVGESVYSRGRIYAYVMP